MPTDTSLPSPPPHHLQQWIQAFGVDPPLKTQFPLRLPNGVQVPGIDCACAQCGCLVQHGMVRGRVFWSMPGVATVEASGYCQTCQIVTRIHCRLRVFGATYRAEWLGTDNRWRAQVIRPPSAWDRLAKCVKAAFGR